MEKAGWLTKKVRREGQSYSRRDWLGRSDAGSRTALVRCGEW